MLGATPIPTKRRDQAIATETRLCVPPLRSAGFTLALYGTRARLTRDGLFDAELCTEVLRTLDGTRCARVVHAYKVYVVLPVICVVFVVVMRR